MTPWLWTCFACGAATLWIPDRDTSAPIALAVTGATADTSHATAHTGNTAHTGDTANDPTGDTGGTIVEPFDCTIPAPVPTWTLIAGVPVSEEFAFDALGNMVNVDDNAEVLLLTPLGGPPVVVAPYDNVELAGTRVLIDGDYAIADEWNGSITRNTPTGARTELATGLIAPNSLAVGNDGMLYATAFDQIRRIDPITLDMELLYEVPGADLDGLTFNPDFSALYFNEDDAGAIGRLLFDTSGAVTGFEPITILPTSFAVQLDGMAMDTCSNLYVTRTDGRVTRVAPDGSAELIVEIVGGSGVFTSSAHFGSGIGGWEPDHLYVMDRSQGLWDVNIGIPGAWEPHLPPP